MNDIPNEVDEEIARSTPGSNIDRWKMFFETYYDMITYKTPKDGQVVEVTEKERPYIYQIKRMGQAVPYIYTPDKVSVEMGTLLFVLDYADLVRARDDLTFEHSNSPRNEEDEKVRYLSFRVMSRQIRDRWDLTKSEIKQAVYDLLKEYSNATHIDDPEKIVLVVHNYDITKPIFNLWSTDLEKFRRLEVIIAEYDDQASIETISKAYKCYECEYTMALLADRKMPTKCPQCQKANTLVEDKANRKSRDFMYFVGQDSGTLRKGQIVANTINISCTETPFVDSVYNIMEIGRRIAVNGIVRLAEGAKGVARGSLEFECLGIEILAEKSEYDKDIRSLVEREISPEEMENHYSKLLASYAPHLYGLELEKEVLLLHAASGGSMKAKDETTRIRGRMNTLLLGDTGTGKTELLNFHSRLHPSSILTTGSHVSRVGLTASTKKLKSVRGGEIFERASIDPGPYGSCRGGDVCCDEWDKVANKDIYESVASPMDNYQTMRVDKAEAHKTIRVNCGSLHAANPYTGSGKYDTSLSVFKQTNFAHWLFSRYDFKLLFLADNSDQARHLLWERKAKTMENMVLDTEGDVDRVKLGYNDDMYGPRRIHSRDFLNGETYPFDYLVAELQYVIEKYPDPVLKPNSMAWIMMMKFWDQFNKISIVPDTDITGEKTQFVPALDNRGQDAMIRAAKARARLHRRNEVTTEDMNVVMALMRDSVRRFIPHIDIRTEMERENQMTRDLLNETIRSAMLFATREINQKIMDFYYALVKTLNAIHKEYFMKCDICNGKGYVSQKIGYMDAMEKNNYCTACHNDKGYYKKLSFAEFEKVCHDVGMSFYCDDFFSLLTKGVKFLRKDEAVTTTIYYHVDRKRVTTLTAPRMLQDIQRAINDMFGMDEATFMEMRKLILANHKSRKA